MMNRFKIGDIIRSKAYGHECEIIKVDDNYYKMKYLYINPEAAYCMVEGNVVSSCQKSLEDRWVLWAAGNDMYLEWEDD